MQKKNLVLLVVVVAILLISAIGIGVLIKNNSQYGFAKQTPTNAEQQKSLPVNTKETKAGTIVQVPDKWKTEVTSTTKVATVYAVAVGSGEAVPVPYGFYYVGGNLTTGVVISDDPDDKYTDTDRTGHEYATQLQGNQFVWIPCTVDSYKKIDFGKTNTDAWDTSTNTAEKTQIAKYGGFYVGRYEAGTSDIKGINFAAAATTSNWWLSGYEYTNVTSGNITTKAGEIPWYHANYMTAVEMSERMINTQIQTDQVMNILHNYKGTNLYGFHAQ